MADKQTGLVRSMKKQQSEPGDGKKPYIRMQHFDLIGRWNEDDLTYVGVSKAEFDEYELRSDDLLFNTRNSFKLVGKTSVWPEGKPGYVYNNNLLRLRFVFSVDPRWMGLQMQGLNFRDRVRDSKSATTSICAIYQKDLFPQPVALPPLKEQHQTVSEVERLLSVADEALQTVERELKRAERLRQSILKRAFSGKLVAQGDDVNGGVTTKPNDAHYKSEQMEIPFSDEPV